MKALGILTALMLLSPIAKADRCHDNGLDFDCFANGSDSNPSVSVGNKRTGIYSGGNGDIRFSILGVQVGRIDANGQWVILRPLTIDGSLAVSGPFTAKSVEAEEFTGKSLHLTGVMSSESTGQILGGLNHTPVGQSGPAPGAFTTLQATDFEAKGIKINSQWLMYSDVPTIVSGFGDTASVTNSNGTASFAVVVGHGSSKGVIGMPKARNGWACSAADVSEPDHNMTQQTGSSPSSVTLTNYARTTGLPANWNQNDMIELSCFPN